MARRGRTREPFAQGQTLLVRIELSLPLALGRLGFGSRLGDGRRIGRLGRRLRLVLPARVARGFETRAKARHAILERLQVDRRVQVGLGRDHIGLLAGSDGSHLGGQEVRLAPREGTRLVGIRHVRRDTLARAAEITLELPDPSLSLPQLPRRVRELHLGVRERLLGPLQLGDVGPAGAL